MLANRLAIRLNSLGLPHTTPRAHTDIHHEKVTTHFGEISSLWDYLLGTSDIFTGGLRAGYRWHFEKHALRSVETKAVCASEPVTSGGMVGAAANSEKLKQKQMPRRVQSSPFRRASSPTSNAKKKAGGSPSRRVSKSPAKMLDSRELDGGYWATEIPRHTKRVDKS